MIRKVKICIERKEKKKKTYCHFLLSLKSKILEKEIKKLGSFWINLRRGKNWENPRSSSTKLNASAREREREQFRKRFINRWPEPPVMFDYYFLMSVISMSCFLLCFKFFSLHKVMHTNNMFFFFFFLIKIYFWCNWEDQFIKLT